MRRITLAALLLVLALPSFARVISYSPYTDRTAIPAHQHRMNRYFALMESPAAAMGGGFMPPIYTPGFQGQVVLYDFRGEEEPRVVYPEQGTVAFSNAAVFETAGGVPWILLSSSDKPGEAFRYRLSTNAGMSWSTLDIPVLSNPGSVPTGIDIGGPFAAARGSQVRIGNEQRPFIVATGAGLYAIGADGSAQEIHTADFVKGGRLIGRDLAGTRFLVAATNGELHMLHTEWMTTTLVTSEKTMYVDGWIGGGTVYVEGHDGANITLYTFTAAGDRAQILQAPATSLNLFAVPTHDYAGAWIIERGAGKPTILHRHSGATGLQKQWEDITAPQVEALHTGSSGNKVLIQVHRPRPQADQRIFQDPALAVWTVGQPAPRLYDELYMDEQFNKGFVHLDVEKIAAGEPFVFDSGVRMFGPPPPPGGISPSVPGGGGDVVQEWGVVRASLKQRLVLPAVGRTAGAYDSYWVTDVILHNPTGAPQNVDIRFAPTGASTVVAQHPTRTVTLAANEIRLVEDALQSLFGIESGTGAFFVEPESGIGMTSRTYSRSATGTYGFGMHAIDIYASAASARFPLTFSGAFLGMYYRTNVVITDAGEHGSVSNMRAAGTLGLMGLSDVRFPVTARGQQQINSIGPMLGLFPHETGAILFRPERGSAIGSVFAIDNRTNDSTYFPPDLPAPVVRTIPAIGHVDGANKSKFRSDLYLYNPTNQVRSVLLQMQLWDSPVQATQSFTMLPNEARVIKDILPTLFGRTGIARLRYQSTGGDSNGVRVTSRTYSEREDGGTYGFLMPPLNNFQSGGSGDTLEILGAVAHADYRTNIGLVDLNAFATGQSINVKIEIVNKNGAVADSFTVNLPTAGGMQLNDVFRARDLSVSGPVLIRVSPLGGLVGAYATHIDNRTNDASYLAANLAAKQ